jgi:V/A-type H+-transporting ATPase subunit I
MAIRPEEAHWFELYVPREQTVYAVEALANTNLVQLEIDPVHRASLDLRQLKESIYQYRKLGQCYLNYLPEADQYSTAFESTPDEEAQKALARLQAYCKEIDAILEEIHVLGSKLDNLLLLKEYLISLESERDILAAIAHHSEFLFKAIYACPHHCCLAEDDEVNVSLSQVSYGENHDFYLVADTPDRQTLITDFFKSSNCILIDIPQWLAADQIEQETQLLQEINSLTEELNALRSRLDQFSGNADAGRAISNLELLAWYVEHAKETSFEKKLCHITGWSSSKDPKTLQKALDKDNIHSIVRFSKPPMGTKPPVSTKQSWWAQPFQIFTSMLGTPGHAEVDPGVVLPFIVPLLFGYMFPDVVHGLVLMLVSLLLFKHWPAGRFLIPCGLVASLFGLIFGEVLGLHGVLTPLWIQPLENPIAIMLVPIVFGVMLMLLGLVFNAVEAWWRGEFKLWALTDAPVLMLYASALVAVFYSAALWITAISLVWYVVGSIPIVRQNPLYSMAAAMGHLFQSIFELFVNTISFLRVGAFALAHAALTSGIMELVGQVDNLALRLTLLVILHIVFIALEAFIVFVQTTRLVLFEFFIRFLHAEGRVFRPMEQPHFSHTGKRS